MPGVFTHSHSEGLLGKGKMPQILGVNTLLDIQWDAFVISWRDSWLWKTQPVKTDAHNQAWIKSRSWNSVKGQYMVSKAGSHNCVLDYVNQPTAFNFWCL